MNPNDTPETAELRVLTGALRTAWKLRIEKNAKKHRKARPSRGETK